MHKIIKWTKKVRRDDTSDKKTCLDSSTWPHKLKSLMKIQFTPRITLFQETLKFKQNIF